MRVVVVGNRELAKHVLRHLLQNDWNVVGAVSPAGGAAKRQAGFASFTDLVTERDVRLIETQDINNTTTRDALSQLEPDLCICPGWHQIVDQEILDIPAQGFVGFHSSRLPEGRGGAPVNWSIIAGCRASVALTVYYTQGVDDGPVIAQQSVSVDEWDTVDTIFDRLSWAACDILSEQREAFHNRSVDTIDQSIERTSYRPRRQPQDGLIDWANSADTLFDWLRAQTSPYPEE